MTQELDQRLKEIPADPGIYQFRDRNGQLLYIGKAKNLRKRVCSYFQRTKDLEPPKQIMVRRIAKIEFTIVDSEIEALLLEANLIQKHQPPFNVMLRDDKSFSYIKITTRDDFPIIARTRRLVRDGSRYFGPYTSSLAVRNTLIALKYFFPYPSCTISRSGPCLEVKHGQSIGPARGEASKEDYRQAIARVIDFLSGRNKDYLRNVERKMKMAAATHRFEEASQLRDRLFELQKMVEQQKVVSTHNEAQDIFAMSLGKEMAAVSGFVIRGGKLLHQANFLLNHVQLLSKEEILSAFLEQYYARSLDFPKEIIVPVEPNNRWLIETLTRAKVLLPSRGKKKHFLQMGEKNAEEYLKQHLASWEREEVKAQHALEGLQRLLKLPRLPERIEGYDISNIQGVEAVGSMVVFEHGVAAPKQYRKFKIRLDGKPNDFAMMREMLDRRFRHAAADREEETRAAWPTPDLVVIDGGKGQLSSALAVLRVMKPKDFDPERQIISLAKREEEIFVPGRSTSIRLPDRSPIIHLLQQLRDEAHRFAITYYRKRHQKATVKSRLDDIPGIGAETRKKLIKAFGSWAGVKQAEEADIAKVIGAQKAGVIVRYR